MAAVIVGVAFAATMAMAQEAGPMPPAHKPGFFEAVGRWFDQSAANFRDSFRGAKRRMDDLSDQAATNSKDIGDKAAEAGKDAADATKNAVNATKDAVDAVAKLPTARIMEGHERCANAPNGAPDCVAAADALCRKHGFASGKSVDFTSAEDCPLKTVIGQSSRDDCTTVTFISRAMCQ